MKQKYTRQRSANRGPSKTMRNAIYSMSVAERRKMGIHAVDSEEYDKKHGIATGSPTKSQSKLRRAFSRRQA